MKNKNKDILDDLKGLRDEIIAEIRRNPKSKNVGKTGCLMRLDRIIKKYDSPKRSVIDICFSKVTKWFRYHILRERYCLYCDDWHKIHDWKVRRLNTAYVEDECNNFFSCSKEYEDKIAYYDELWRDYDRERF